MHRNLGGWGDYLGGYPHVGCHRRWRHWTCRSSRWRHGGRGWCRWRWWRRRLEPGGADSGPEHEEIVVAAVSALGSLVKAEMGIPPDMIVDFISNALDWIRPSAKKIDELRRR